MSNTHLFRRAAIDKCQTKWIGDVVLMLPLSVRFLTSAAAVMALLVVCFFVFGSYTNRTSVSGALVPDTGVLKLYSSQPGVVVQKLVRESQAIKKGDVLYVISSERRSNSAGNIDATVIGQVALRQKSIRDEISHTRRLQEDEVSALRKKIDGLEAEQSNIVRQLEDQRLRVGLAEAGTKRADQLWVFRPNVTAHSGLS